MDALSTLFPSLLADKSSFSSSVYTWWSSELVFNPLEYIRVSSGSSGIVVSLDLWWVAHISPKGSLLVPSKVCSSNIGLLTFDPILKFSSFHTHRVIYIYIYILFFHVFLYILRHNFFFFFFSLPHYQ